MPQRTLLASARAPLAAFVALGLMWGTFAALVPDLKAALALSDPAFGRLLLATSSAALAGMLAAPRAAARLGRGALPVFVVALAAAFAALPHAPGMAAFALALAAIGASAGALDVTMNIHVSAIEAARGRHLMNFAHGSYSLGYAVGAILTGLARGAGGAPGPILAWTAAVALVLAAVATGRRAAPAGSGEAAAGGAPPGTLGPAVVLGGLVIFLAFMAENATEVWSALHIERTLGGAPAVGGLGPGLLGLTMAVGRFGGQIASARVAEGRLMAGAGAVAAAGALLAALAPVPAVAVAGFAILGLGVSVIAPTAFAMIGRGAANDRRAAAIARASAIGYLGFFLGPPLLGLVSGALGLRAAFVAVTVALVLVPALVPALDRRAATRA